MRIMGLDLSLNATGVCLPDGRVMVVKGWRKWGDHRLQVIRDAVRLCAQRTDLVVIEGMGRFKGNTGLVIAEVHGTVKVELMDQGVPYAVVTPSTLKKFATGNGNADKDMMIAAARRRAGLVFKDHNQCDAWWLREAGLDHYKQPVSIHDPDPALSALLDVVEWPVLPSARP